MSKPTEIEQLQAIARAARSDYEAARLWCKVQKSQGKFCPAFAMLGKSCAECPLQWFGAIEQALEEVPGDEPGEQAAGD